MDTTGQTEKLLAQIREAFQGVELGEGVSLYQAIVIDCYGSDEEQQEARAKDEQHDWQKMITMPEIRSALSNAISFFDALGARFHLPVCLSLAVMDPDANHSLLSSLDPSHFDAHQLLTEVQRQCVRDVLQFTVNHFTEQNDPFLRTDLLPYWDANATEDDRQAIHLEELRSLGFLVTAREVIYTIEAIDGMTPPS